MNNIAIIDGEFRNFGSTEASTPENQRKLRACISLIHAEFESYFELIASRIIDAYGSTLTRKQKALINNFMMFYSLRIYEGQAISVNERINLSLSAYKAGIVQNNGIKEKDILKILLPVGITISEIDSAWLTSLNSFGSLRGDLIHKNINQITKNIGFRYIDETVHRILVPGVQTLDSLILTRFRL